MPIPVSKKQTQFQAPKVAEGQAVDVSKQVAQAYQPVIDMISNIQKSGNAAVQFFKEREIAESKNTIDIANTNLNERLNEIEGEYKSKVGQDKLDYYNGTGKYKGLGTLEDRIKALFQQANNSISTAKTDYLAKYAQRDLVEQEAGTLANYFADKSMAERQVQHENSEVRIGQKTSNLKSTVAQMTDIYYNRYQTDLKEANAIEKANDRASAISRAEAMYKINLNEMAKNLNIEMARISAIRLEDDITQGKSKEVASYNQRVLKASLLKDSATEMLNTLPVGNLKETNGLIDDFVDKFQGFVNYQDLSTIKHDILLEGLNIETMRTPQQFLNADGTINTKAIDDIAEGKLTQTERNKVISEFDSFLRQYGRRGLTAEEKEIQDDLTLQVRGQVHDILANKFKTGLDFKQINDFVSYLVNPISEEGGSSKNRKDMADAMAGMFRNESLGSLMMASMEIDSLLDEGHVSPDGKTIKVDSDFRKQIKTKMQDAIQAKISQVANSKLDNRTFLQKFYKDEDLTALNFAISQMVYANKQKDKDGKYSVDSYKILRASRIMLSGGGPLGQLSLIGDGSQDGDYLMKNVRDKELWNNKQFWNNLALNASMAMEYVDLGTNEDFSKEVQKQTKLAERARQGALYKQMSDKANYINTFSNDNSYKYTTQYQRDLAAMPSYLTGVSNTPAPVYGYNNIPYNNLNLNPKLYDLEEIPDEYDTVSTRKAKRNNK